MIPDLGRALFDGIEALEAVGVRYAMVGGLAVSAWATPRATGDADLYVQRWARMLDESIGGNDVSERVRAATAAAKARTRRRG